MHIEDFDKIYLSRFSPETYVNNLVKAGIQNAMLYFQSHVGLCYYPTKTGVMHKSFVGREDTMKKTVELCHKNGIKVTGYYSLIYNTREHDRHPEWRMLTEDGKSRREKGETAAGAKEFESIKTARYGLCCPNNGEYTGFVYTQIDEITEYFDMDAMFFDMPFWPHTCYCDSCKKRWKTEFGGEIPVSPEVGGDKYILLLDAKYRWMGEWVQKISSYVKNRVPGIPVEFNYAEGIAGNSLNGCGAEVNDACDYCGGDLYGGAAEHSFSCKFYKNSTKNQPFEYMFSRCKPSLRSHTLTKTPDEMKTSVAITASHHGATLVIDAIDPIGTLDNRVYRQIGKVFGYQKAYEPYFRGTMLEDIGIYYGIRSKSDPDNDGKTSITASLGVSRTLIRKHIPFGVTGSFYRLGEYKAIFAPLLSEAEVKDNIRLIDYVKNGGVLYISGGRNKTLVEELTGGRITGKTDENNLYIAPVKSCRRNFLGFREISFSM